MIPMNFMKTVVLKRFCFMEYFYYGILLSINENSH